MIHLAPVQGHTEAPFRHFHAEAYGGDLITYYTPFIRLEHGEVRRKDENDAFSPLNSNQRLVHQLIFRDEAELSSLMDWAVEHDLRNVNINMGCPFPLQTAKGRGAATVARPEAADAVENAIANALQRNPDMQFSVKMRLGMKDSDEWIPLIERLNNLPLSYIAVHPRVARQQYGGEVDLDAFARMLKASRIPLIYNGDIRTPEDAARIRDRFPEVTDIMIGRGILARPSLAAEIESGEEWSRERRVAAMLELHSTLLSYYEEKLVGGDHQILSKIKPFWEYAEEEIGRKAWKGIKKASNMAKYHTAVASIEV